MINIYNKNNLDEFYLKLKNRSDNIPDDVLISVNKIIEDVKKYGDEAVIKYTKKFDGVDCDIRDIYMTEEEKNKTINKAPKKLRAAMERAAENILAFHEAQKQQSWMTARGGKIMGQRILPLKNVGMYVPGGSAAYPSSLLMNAIPAKVAGVDDLIMATPPKKDGLAPAVILAAEIAGVKNIVKIGGAQIIAALAYGTETIKRVDKIVGPGNIYVAAAKRMVYGTVDIDMIAGPSEILIVADETADPKYIAADLLSQAEHDANAAAILISSSAELVELVKIELEKQFKKLSRKDIILKSLETNGAAIIVDDIEQAYELSDLVAPEHLELMIKAPFENLAKIRNAGSVFLGSMAPEPLGDYYAGPNHILPTNGTARFASALSVDSFMKKSGFLYYSREEFEKIKDDVILLAETEGLDAHANSVKARFEI